MSVTESRTEYGFEDPSPGFVNSICAYLNGTYNVLQNLRKFKNLSYDSHYSATLMTDFLVLNEISLRKKEVTRSHLKDKPKFLGNEKAIKFHNQHIPVLLVCSIFKFMGQAMQRQGQKCRTTSQSIQGEGHQLKGSGASCVLIVKSRTF